VPEPEPEPDPAALALLRFFRPKVNTSTTGERESSGLSPPSWSEDEPDESDGVGASSAWKGGSTGSWYIDVEASRPGARIGGGATARSRERGGTGGSGMSNSSSYGWVVLARIKNQESRIKNQESRIKNQESRIKNQESRIKWERDVKM
jgi:hypothetical protein